MNKTLCQVSKYRVLIFLSAILSLTISNSSFVYAQSRSLLSKDDQSAQTTKTLEVTKVGETTVLPGMIFLESKDSNTAISGTALANSSISIDLDNKKSTAKSDADGKWTFNQTLKNGDYDLKISTSDQTKIYKLTVVSSKQASGVLTDTTETTPSATTSPSLESSSSTSPVFNQEETAGTPTEESSNAESSNPLQNYLPFILGGLGIGVILFLISRLLKPKQEVVSELETPPTPVTPTATPAPTSEITPPSVSQPEPGTDTQGSWSPSVNQPDTVQSDSIATPTPPAPVPTPAPSSVPEPGSQSPSNNTFPTNPSVYPTQQPGSSANQAANPSESQPNSDRNNQA